MGVRAGAIPSFVEPRQGKLCSTLSRGLSRHAPRTRATVGPRGLLGFRSLSILGVREVVGPFRQGRLVSIYLPPPSIPRLLLLLIQDTCDFLDLHYGQSYD